jgi:phosphatidylglycerophosphatase C
MAKQQITVFDFDGTLTTKDTFLEFIKFSKGKGAFLLGFLLHFPLLVLMKLKLYSNWKIKQMIFSYFFKDMTITDFDKYCIQFAKKHQLLLRPKGLQFLRKHLTDGDTVLIISASIDNWVKPFFLGIPIKIVGTRLEIDIGRKLTGRFLSKNCYGKEKVTRLLELYPKRDEYFLVTYGNSRGDKELIDFSDEGWYNNFI